jgi:hypothetical protein
VITSVTAAPAMSKDASLSRASGMWGQREQASTEGGDQPTHFKSREGLTLTATDRSADPPKLYFVSDKLCLDWVKLYLMFGKLYLQILEVALCLIKLGP